MNLAIFDIDGTLTSPYEVEDECYLAALGIVFGPLEVDTDWSSYPHVTDTGLLHELCRRHLTRVPTPAEVSRFRAAYCLEFGRRKTAQQGAEIPGASRFLRDLRLNPNWGIAVATGNFRALAIEKLQQIGPDFLDFPMATADDAIERPALIRLATARAEVAYGVTGFRHIVSIGDASWDLRTARELGLPFVAVGNRWPAAPGVIRDYRESASVLRRLEHAVCW